MPHIHMKSCKSVANRGKILDDIERAVRQHAAWMLTVPKRKLTPADFSVSTEKLDRKKMTKDVEVIIFAHNDDERLQRMEEISLGIARRVRNKLYELRVKVPVSISVSIILAPIGYVSLEYQGFDAESNRLEAGERDNQAETA